MIIVMSHANHIEWSEIDCDTAYSLQYFLDMNGDLSVDFTNYNGDPVVVKCKDLCNRIRFYRLGEIEIAFLRKFSKNNIPVLTLIDNIKFLIRVQELKNENL